MSRYFPLFVDLEQRRVLLFGAGQIASRRLGGLLRFGAQVTVIAPEIGEAAAQLIKQYAPQVTVQRRGYRHGDIADAELVLSATDCPQIDRQIFEECRQKGIPVNIASDQTLCDFYFPALIEQDGLVIGVSSGGSDHRKVRRVSAALREALAGQSEPLGGEQ